MLAVGRMTQLGSQNQVHLILHSFYFYQNLLEKGIAAALEVIILLCDRQQEDMQDSMRNKVLLILFALFLVFL